MLNRPESSDARRQQLSSLMDGDLPADEATGACALWRHDAAARQDWHAWHLIGDVLRSDDLAVRPARDEAFLQTLRLRLADEPVPLAPQAAASREIEAAPLVANGVVSVPARRGRHWLMAPVAVAAGFVAVAGVMVVTRMVSPEPAAAVLAEVRPAPAAAAAAASAVLVRNAQLDRYLSAHRALANGAMAGAAEHRVYIVFEGQ